MKRSGTPCAKMPGCAIPAVRLESDYGSVVNFNTQAAGSTRLNATRRCEVCVKSPSLQRLFRLRLDRRPLLQQLVEPLVRAGADFLIRAADFASDVRHLVDEHLVFVRTGLRHQLA